MLANSQFEGNGRKGNPPTLLVGRSVADVAIPEDFLEIDTRWPHDPAVPLQRNSNTHRHQHVLYKDPWTVYGGRQGPGAGAGETKPDRGLVRLDLRSMIHRIHCTWEWEKLRKKRFHSHQRPNSQIARNLLPKAGGAEGGAGGAAGGGARFRPRLGVAPFVMGGELKRRQGNWGQSASGRHSLSLESFFFFGCAGSSFLCSGPSLRMRAVSSCGSRA